MQFFPGLFGTKNIIDTASKYGAESFVLVSTDKAVNPTSMMGATKRVAEFLAINMNGYSNTRFSTVRFGNVLGSNGSVVPIFKEQLKNGGPLTVTHPEIERFFMLIPEAVQLVQHAVLNNDVDEVETIIQKIVPNFRNGGVNSSSFKGIWSL